MPCPKGKKLKASHGKLGDLVSSYVPSWLPDGTAEFLHDVISEVLEYIQGGDHLAVVEGFHHSLAEDNDSLEHVHSVHVDSCCKESRFPLRATCIFSVIVLMIDGQFRSLRPAHTVLVNKHPELQTERKASAFTGGSEGVALLVLPLRGIKSGQGQTT